MIAVHSYVTKPLLVDRFAMWIASGLGVGFAFPAPGTIGGLWGLPLVLGIHRLPAIEWQAAAIAALIVASVAVCTRAASAIDASCDPQPIVLDEIVVLPLVFLGVSPMNWRILLAGFALFRIFDIWKPGLTRQAERLPDGWGIVADDALAAALAWAVLRGLLWLAGATGVDWLAAA